MSDDQIQGCRERLHHQDEQKTEEQLRRQRNREHQRWLNMSDEQRPKRRERRHDHERQSTEEELQRRRNKEQQRWLNMSDERRQRRREQQRNAYYQRRLSILTTERNCQREDGNSQTSRWNAISMESEVGCMRNNAPQDVVQATNVNGLSVSNTQDQSLFNSMRLSHVRRLARRTPNQVNIDLQYRRVDGSGPNSELLQETRCNTTPLLARDQCSDIVFERELHHEGAINNDENKSKG